MKRYENKKPSIIGIILACIVLFITFKAIQGIHNFFDVVSLTVESSSVKSISTKSPSPTEETGETMSAIRASKKIARAHVDESTSCKFHDMPWYCAVTYHGNNKYTVTGEVEMQSIFGQTRTRKYTTTFVLLPDDEYDPDDVSIKWYDK